MMTLFIGAAFQDLRRVLNEVGNKTVVLKQVIFEHMKLSEKVSQKQAFNITVSERVF
jgi:hypothetical protein